MKLNKTLISAAIVASLAYSQGSFADTTIVNGAAALPGGTGAAVDLDFVINIPAFLSFRVGAAAKSTVTFSPTVADVLAPTAGMAGTGGDLGTGRVTVEIRGNGGSVQITEATTGATGLSNGTGTISWAQIISTDTGAGTITPPVLSEAVSKVCGDVHTDRNTGTGVTYDAFR